MLRRLQIRNYALIRELDVDFTSGLTIITGETGAGKSILIGALSLILGQRADTTVLKDKEEKCSVEGVFEVAGYGLEELFAGNDLDYDSQVIFRREITANGKSRAFVNDTPVNLKTLQDLGLHLIDIHSQHQSLELGNRLFQLMVLDSYAGNKEFVKEYQSKYRSYKALLAELASAEEQAKILSKELDYFQFQMEQLTKARTTGARTDAAHPCRGDQDGLVDSRQPSAGGGWELLGQDQGVDGSTSKNYKVLSGSYGPLGPLEWNLP